MRLRTATATLLLVAATLVAACGSDDEQGDPIPAATAAELEKQLASVQDRFDFGGGACGDIPENQASVNQAIESLPAGTDQDVRDALQEGFDRLFELTSEQCDEGQGQDTTEETTPTETTEEPTETTETVPPPDTETTETVPPPTETTPTDGEDGETPDSGDGGGGVAPEDDG